MDILNTIEKNLIPFLIGCGFGAAVLSGAALIYDKRPPEPLVTCQFKNMTKRYWTTQEEADLQTIMITVHEGNRTFMFRRDNLTACYDANETP